VPEIGPTEVLIAVHTAGVGSWDAEMRGGWWPEKKRPPFPIVLGTDGSGTIAAVGSRVRRFAPGDRVYGYSFGNRKGGFFAEYVAVDAENVARPTDILGLKEAGAVAAIGLTAQQGVDDVRGSRRDTCSERLSCAFVRANRRRPFIAFHWQSGVRNVIELPHAHSRIAALAEWD
jgi:NADPH2:quinone reductase